MASDVPIGPGGLVAMLDLLAETIVEALGFGVAVFNIARPDGSLDVVSVAGDDNARAALLGTAETAGNWDRALANSEHWGRLRFLNHTKIQDPDDELMWVPDFEPATDEDAWHPEDALFAPLTAADGSLLGVLSVDLPRGLRLPDTAARSGLEAFAISAALAIENRSLSEELTEAQKVARMGSLRVDFRTGTTAWSEELYRLLRCDPAGPPWSFEELREAIHEDDVAALDSAVGSGAFDVELRVRRLDGHLIWLRVQGEAQTQPGGGPGRVLATLQEVTEQKVQDIRLREALSQEALVRAVTSAANESATLDAALDLSADRLRAVDPTCRLVSFTVEELDGAGRLSVRPTPEGGSRAGSGDRASTGAVERAATCAARERRLIIEQPEGTGSTTAAAYPVLRDGKVVTVCVLTSTTTLSRSTWEIVATAAAEQAAQVSEREHTHAALAAARDAAMSASRLKSDFLATMSHEVRTPINGVLGLNDLLLRTPLEPNQQRLGEGVRDAGRALLAIIDDILDFSKIEAGKLELEDVDFDLHVVVDRVAALLGERAHTFGVELVVDVDPDVPSLLRGDPTRLGQVLTNLVSNAVKFTPGGDVVVRCMLDTEPADQASDGGVRLRWEVQDTGIGIPAEHLDHLFEPFSQAESSTTRKYGGSGLGLAICEQIVSAMGGRLGAASTVGEGSTFWFTLTVPAAGAAASRTDVGGAPDLAGRRVLVVDPSAASRRMLARTLAGWGVVVEAAADGVEALARCDSGRRGERLDAVLIDARMPHVGGVPVARALHACASPPRSTILMSASQSVDDSWIADAAIDAVVTKPVGHAAVRDALTAAWDADGALPTTTRGATSGAAGSRGRVLLVEDNEINRMVATGLLDHLGYDVDVARDGEVAVAMAAHERYAAILMDVQMPRMDGYTATRLIRSGHGANAGTFIVAVTAAVVSGERDRCLASGMDEFVTKPIDLRLLEQVLRRGRSGGGAAPRATPAGRTAGGTATEAHPGALVDPRRLQELLEMGPGADVLVRRAVQGFVDRAPQTVAEVRQARDVADLELLRTRAHHLKGSASTLGAVAVSAALEQLEALTVEALGDAEPLLDHLEGLLVPTIDALRGIMASAAARTGDRST